MYNRLHWFMSLGVGPVLPPTYGPGFVNMAEEAGYTDFSYATDYFVTGSDYWKRVADINNGRPIALLSPLFYYGGAPHEAHWIAIKGYKYPGAVYQHEIVCTDSYKCTSSLWIDWDHIGLPPVVTVTIKGSTYY